MHIRPDPGHSGDLYAHTTDRGKLKLRIRNYVWDKTVCGVHYKELMVLWLRRSVMFFQSVRSSETLRMWYSPPCCKEEALSIDIQIFLCNWIYFWYPGICSQRVLLELWTDCLPETTWDVSSAQEWIYTLKWIRIKYSLRSWCNNKYRPLASRFTRTDGYPG